MTARLLVDQCVSRTLVEPISSPLADVLFVWDAARNAVDEDVLALACAEDRILMTEDFDFGRLIFGDRLPAPPGLIHLVLEGMSRREREERLFAHAVGLLARAQDRFVVISKDAIRARRLR